MPILTEAQFFKEKEQGKNLFPLILVDVEILEYDDNDKQYQWVKNDNLWPISCSQEAAPQVGSARFSYIGGSFFLPQLETEFVRRSFSSSDYQGKRIRVLIYSEDDPLNKLLIWEGIIINFSHTTWGTDQNDKDVIVNAYEYSWFLAREKMDRAKVAFSPGALEEIIDIDWSPVFNGRSKVGSSENTGNRASQKISVNPDNPNIYLFGGFNPALDDENSSVIWNADDVIHYIPFVFSPDGLKFEVETPGLIDPNDPASGKPLEKIIKTWDLESSTPWDAMSQVASRKNGFVVVIEPQYDTQNPNRAVDPKIIVRTTVSEDVPNTPLTANPLVYTILVIDYQKHLFSELDYQESEVFEKLTVFGERMVCVGTWWASGNLSLNGLSPYWSEQAETDYMSQSGIGNEPGIASKLDRAFQHVFKSLKINTENSYGFNSGIFNDGPIESYPLFPTPKADGTFDYTPTLTTPHFKEMATINRHLPIRTNQRVSVSENNEEQVLIDLEYIENKNENNEFLPYLLMYKSSFEVPHVIRDERPNGLTNESNQDDGVQFTYVDQMAEVYPGLPNFQPYVMESEPVVSISGCSPTWFGYYELKDSPPVIMADEPPDYPELSWKDLVFTASITSDKRQRVSKTIWEWKGEEDPDPKPIIKEKRIYISGAENWQMLPGTWLGPSYSKGPIRFPENPQVEKDGKDIYKIRDDVDKLKDVFDVAANWFFKPRLAVNMKINQLCYFAPIGSMFYSAPTLIGTTLVDTPIVSKTWNFEDGATTIETAWAELDFIEAVGADQ